MSSSISVVKNEDGSIDVWASAPGSEELVQHVNLSLPQLFQLVEAAACSDAEHMKSQLANMLIHGRHHIEGAWLKLTGARVVMQQMTLEAPKDEKELKAKVAQMITAQQVGLTEAIDSAGKAYGLTSTISVEHTPAELQALKDHGTVPSEI